MGTDKAMLAWPPPQPNATEMPRHTLLSASLLALGAVVQATIVVAGKNAESIATTVNSAGATLVQNPNPENGQFSSLQIALRAVLDLGFDAAAITPVDCPPLRASSLQLLCGAFFCGIAKGAWAVAPEHDGKHGHPLFANRDLIDAFLQSPVAGNAREVLHANASRILYVPVPDLLVKAGLNTPKDYVLHGLEATPESG